MMSGITTAVSIVAGHTAAVFLVVYGAVCGCPWGMNLCWSRLRVPVRAGRAGDARRAEAVVTPIKRSLGVADQISAALEPNDRITIRPKVMSAAELAHVERFVAERLSTPWEREMLAHIAAVTAQRDAMRPVFDAARAWVEADGSIGAIVDAVAELAIDSEDEPSAAPVPR